MNSNVGSSLCLRSKTHGFMVQIRRTRSSEGRGSRDVRVKFNLITTIFILLNFLLVQKLHAIGIRTQMHRARHSLISLFWIET